MVLKQVEDFKVQQKDHKELLQSKMQLEKAFREEQLEENKTLRKKQRREKK